MSEYLVEPFDQSHIDDVAIIELACFPDPWSKQQLSEHIQSPSTYSLVCTKDKQAIGYVGSHVILDEMYITNIAVLEQFRRFGIGSMLIDGMINKAKQSGIAFISLEVRTSNIPAKLFYEKFGFKKHGERKNYYENPCENAEIMTLYFSHSEE